MIIPKLGLHFCQKYSMYEGSSVLLGGVGSELRGGVDFIKRYGLVTENDFPFQELYHINSDNYKEYYNKYCVFADKESFSDINAVRMDLSNKTQIKKHIKEKGAVNFNIGQGTFSPAKSLAKDGNETAVDLVIRGRGVQHAVAAIGWDDEFEAIVGDKTYKGAFIVLNSWGNNKHRDGVFYVPYELIGGYKSVISSIYALEISKVNEISINSPINVHTDKAEKYGYNSNFKSKEQYTCVNNIFEKGENIDITYNISNVKEIKIYADNIDVTSNFNININKDRTQVTCNNPDKSVYKLKIKYNNSANQKKTYTTQIFVWDYASLGEVVLQLNNNAILFTNFNTYNSNEKNIQLFNIHPNTERQMVVNFPTYHKIKDIKAVGSVVKSYSKKTNGAYITLNPCDMGVYEFKIILNNSVEYNVKYVVGGNAAYASILRGDINCADLYTFKDGQDKYLLPNLNDNGKQEFIGWNCNGKRLQKDELGKYYITQNELKTARSVNYFTKNRISNPDYLSLKKHCVVEPVYSQDEPEILENLEIIKLNAKNSLEDYKNINDYADLEKQEVINEIRHGKDAINSATTEKDIENALLYAKNQINKIKTKAQLSQEKAFVEAKNNLKREIESAKILKRVEISTDGKNILKSNKWVTQEVDRDFSYAIDHAEASYKNSLNKDLINIAIDQLNSSKNIYINAQKYGLKDNNLAASKGGGGSSSGGGGSSSSKGGGSSSGGGVSVTSNSGEQLQQLSNEPIKLLPKTAKVSVSIPYNNISGKVTTNITENTVTDAIKLAQQRAVEKGIGKNDISIEINVNTGNSKVNTLNINFPKKVQTQLIQQVKYVQVKNNSIGITLDDEALKQINDTINSDVSIYANKINNQSLSLESKNIVGNRKVYDIKIVGNNGKIISNFNNGKVTVSIPYIPSANQKVENIVAVYIDTNQKVHYISNSSYDFQNKTLMFVTDHFSLYGIGYKDSLPLEFNDTVNHWAKSDIDFVTTRGLLNGLGNNKFSPDTPITRGMLITALGKLVNINNYTNSSFIDVKNTDYYMPYIEWGNKNEILKGISTLNFAPNQSITSEEMVAIITNFVKQTDYKLANVYSENIFYDNGNFSSYAKDSIKYMYMAGIMIGKCNNNFDPQGIVTRAESSLILRKLIEIGMKKEKAQGWIRNESGWWRYYNNGVKLSGKQTINGVLYDFGS